MDPVGITRHAYFHFDVAEVPGAWPDFARWPLIRTRPEPVLTALFRCVLDRIYMHPDWPAAPPGRVDGLSVETLLSLFLEGPHAERAEFERDRPVQIGRTISLMRNTIDTDPHRHLTLEELAKAGGVSKKHLCRTFSSVLGYSPVETYRLLCLQLSLSLLARSNLSIREIADRCGFEDPAYFSRAFSKVFGYSPKKARDNMRKGTLPPSNPLPVDLTPRLFW
jgi:AraC-like DNA-binding protein